MVIDICEHYVMQLHSVTSRERTTVSATKVSPSFLCLLLMIKFHNLNSSNSRKSLHGRARQCHMPSHSNLEHDIMTLLCFCYDMNSDKRYGFFCRLFCWCDVQCVVQKFSGWNRFNGLLVLWKLCRSIPVECVMAKHFWAASLRSKHAIVVIVNQYAFNN